MLLALSMLAAALGVTVHPVLQRARNDASSLAISLAALAPALWLAALDLQASWKRVSWPTGEGDDDARLFKASLAATVYVWLVYTAVWWSRSPANIEAAEMAASLVWSLFAHGVVFAAVFVVLMLIRGLSGTTGVPARSEFLLVALGVFMALTVVTARVAFAAVVFVGPQATLTAAAFAATLTSVLASLLLGLRAASGLPITSGAGLWLVPAGGGSRTRGGLRLLGLAAIAFLTANGLWRMDWNYLLQKLSALAVWAVSFGTVYAVMGGSRRWSWPALTAAATLWPLGFAVVVRTADHGTAERYANFDPSFRAIRDAILTSEAAQTDSDFYHYLEANTNIPRDRTVEPVEVNLVDALQSLPGPKPNIFVIVVDSLRRDYLSPFNPAVTFTPSVAQFADESDTFLNAFTRYGATGLSEPSIWTGGLLLHKQYVTPFAPMNALQKLLTAERYRQFVSVDTILRVLLEPTPSRTELDAGLQSKDVDLCRSLGELRVKLDGVRGDSAPVFAYMLPQNVHISVINRQGNSVPPGERYPGFYEPYAARVRRVDECFGSFIAHLKATGLYDSSIVVLTSDHGDSLGEDGRFGHAYTIFPEVVRIPLIIHVPPSLRASLATNHNATVFSTDITPTLYALLGHEPTETSTLFGRPLFVPAGRALPAWRGDSLLASSYGTVYGLLHDAGRRLYIVDGINFQDFSYDLERGLVGEQTTVTPDERIASQRAIREQVAEIGRFYGFDSGSP